MGKKELTPEGTIKVWKELDGKSEKPVGVKKVAAEMGVHPYHIEQLFPEGLTEMKREHGIRTAPQEEPYTPDRLLEKFDHIVSKKHEIPTWKTIRFGGITERTIKRLFQKTDDPKRDLIEAYSEWLKKNKQDSENLPLVENWLKGEEKPNVSPVPIAAKSRRRTRLSEKTEGRPLGRLLRYENINMVYGPVNEQGVIVLFAMMSKHLQYNIEGVWPNSYPDCKATRVERDGKLRSVEIEFEFMSKDFVDHNHDPKKCDVLVCWNDNWKERPSNIELLELSKEIEKMQSAKK